MTHSHSSCGSVKFPDAQGGFHADPFDAAITCALDICGCGLIEEISQKVIETLDHISRNPNADLFISAIVARNPNVFADLFAHWFYELELFDHGATIEISSIAYGASDILRNLQEPRSPMWEPEHRFALWHLFHTIERENPFLMGAAVSQWIVRNPYIAMHLFQAFLCYNGMTRKCPVNGVDIYLTPRGSQLLALAPRTELA